MATKKAEPGITTVTLDFTKETPGTLRYDAADDSAAIRNVYIKKSIFGDNKPKQVRLTVTATVATV